MKILIIGFSKIKFMPYLNFYLKNIDNTKHEIHVLYWNRDLKEENLDVCQGTTLHKFEEYQRDSAQKFSKIINFIKFRKYVLKTIEKDKYDFLIVLHTIPGILLRDILKNKYSNNYIFDFRDITYEKNYVYKKSVQDIVKHSRVTFISSNGYSFLMPKTVLYKVFISHNLPIDMLDIVENQYNKLPTKIKISFWGLIREEELNLEIIRKMSEDKRFELHYYGKEEKVAKKLKKYVQDINAKNVFFHGEYIPKDRYKFAQETEILHNMYNSYNSMRAMGNKYYDSIVFKIPQICMVGSEMAYKAEEKGIGLACNPYDEDFTEQIYRYYVRLDIKKFKDACCRELQNIKREYEVGCDVIQKCFE